MHKKEDKSSYAIGGGLIIGMGVGFFFLEQSALLFVGCMFVGLGLGLLFASIISKVNKEK